MEGLYTQSTASSLRLYRPEPPWLPEGYALLTNQFTAKRNDQSEVLGIKVEKCKHFDLAIGIFNH